MKRLIKARFDAAQTTSENYKHWQNADACSADASLTTGARKILRSRSRYETANNSYASGIVDSIANDCIGSGPRLQINGLEHDTAQEVEHAFNVWAECVNLCDKLTLMRRAKCVDGESFAILTDNPVLDNDVRLDIVVLEADRVQSPYLAIDKDDIDGVKIDGLGNPVSYCFRKTHPGASYTLAYAGSEDYVTLEASRVFHWFKKYRPEQHRGLPELTPALPLFAQLRRFTLAVLAGAETAADFALILKSNSPVSVTDDVYGSSEDYDLPQPFIDNVPIEKRMGTVLPEGWDATQLKAEQPCSTYPDFKRELLAEIGRCLNVPINVVSGDSSRHNYASGRLDHQQYHRSVSLEQRSCERVILNRLFRAWFTEYNLTRNSYGMASIPTIRPSWYWDGFEHVDPVKAASAQQIRLQCGMTTYAREFAREGLDVEEMFAQQAKEKKLREEYGLIGAGAEPVVNEGDEDEE